MAEGTTDDRAATAIAAYGEMRAALIADLAATDDDVAAATIVPACPDWTVTGTVAHLAGVCIDIVEGNLDGVGTAPWADGHVARHAPLGLAALLERWAETAPVIDSLGAAIPAAPAMQLCFDGTTHAHDVRGALDLPGDRDGAGVLVGLDFLALGLDRLVRTRDLPPLALDSPTWHHRTGEATDGGARVEASTFELFRGFGGRRSLDQLRALTWTGDPEPYLGFFDGSPLTPPTEAIEE